MAYFRRVWVILAFFLRSWSPAQELPSFRTEVTLVNITAVVRSQQGELMDQLTQDDFEVLEDGVPQKIQFFARKTELPLSLGILVDNSDSQKPFLKQHYRDLSIFLEQVLRPSDQAFAVCFDNYLWLVSDTTSSMLTISHSLQRFAKGDRRVPELGPHETRELGTALYDALYFSVTEKLNRTGERRRALLVFSDGEENSSEHDLLDAIAVAQQTNTLIYSIRYTHQEREAWSARNKYGRRVLRHLASQTGAAEFDGLVEDLPTVFSQIGAELRSLYDIGYLSTHDPHEETFRKVTIRCHRANAVVRSKPGYYPQ